MQGLRAGAVRGGEEGMSKPAGCKGTNYHVYALGATRCTMCGERRK